jgi:DNA-directed RNA polymerase II subunit RPB1
MIDSFEFEINMTLNRARDDAGETALNDLFLWNRLKAMVTAGSKGSNLNISQIMACVGQQNVEGKRIPFGFNQRTLPHFSKDDYGPESKGFVKNCYLNGLTPQEFFFHAMGGREGLIDTAVKTAETGYIQRRLIKALEDVMVKYDGTVRTSKEQVIQFLYGEDGFGAEYVEDLKINLLKQDNNKLESACRFLPPGKPTSELERLVSQAVDPEMARAIVNNAEVALKLTNEFNQIKQDRDDLRTLIFKRSSEDDIHIPVNVPRIIWNAKEEYKIKSNSKSDLHPSDVLYKL